MRTCVRVGGHDPARRSRRVLRLGRATRRSPAPRPARHRRIRRRARRELRGACVRRSHRHGRAPRTPALPDRGRRQPTHVGVRRSEQGRLPRLRGHGATRGGPLDRRGIPRRARARANQRHARRDRSPPPAGGPRAGRAADHGRGCADEVPGQGCKRRCQAGRAARRAAGRRARIPPPPAGGATLGRWSGDVRQAQRAGNPHRRTGRGARRGCTRGDARPRLRSSPACARAQPRSAPRPTAASPGSIGFSGPSAGHRAGPRRGRHRCSSRSSTASPGGCGAARPTPAGTVVLRLRFDDYSRATRSHTLPRAQAEYPTRSSQRCDPLLDQTCCL